MRLYYAILILFILFYNSYCSISQEIVTDRPDQTESPSIVPKSSLQIETGFSVQYAENYSLSETTKLLPSTLFRYGVFDNFELRLNYQYSEYTEKSNKQEISGITDMEFGAKLQFINDTINEIQLAVLSHLLLPTGNKDFSLNKYASISKLAFGHPLTNKIGLSYNLGYDYYGEGNGDLFYSVSTSFDLTENSSFFTEIFGNYFEFEDFKSNFDAGWDFYIDFKGIYKSISLLEPVLIIL